MATHEAKTRSIIQRGTRANQPLATNVQAGTLYYVTDEDIVERSSGSAWQSYSTAAAHLPVTLAGSLDYLTLSGQQITRGAIDLTTDVTGLLPLANVASQVWTPEPFDANDYSGSGSMTWTVASGDVTLNSWVTLLQKTLVISLIVVTTTVGGTPNAFLQFTIPNGYTANRVIAGLMIYKDNGTLGTGTWSCSAGGTTIFFVKGDETAWAASTNNTDIRAQMILEIQ